MYISSCCFCLLPSRPLPFPSKQMSFRSSSHFISPHMPSASAPALPSKEGEEGPEADGKQANKIKVLQRGEGEEGYCARKGGDAPTSNLIPENK